MTDSPPPRKKLKTAKTSSETYASAARLVNRTDVHIVLDEDEVSQTLELQTNAEVIASTASRVSRPDVHVVPDEDEVSPKCSCTICSQLDHNRKKLEDDVKELIEANRVRKIKIQEMKADLKFLEEGYRKRRNDIQKFREEMEEIFGNIIKNC